MKSRERGDSNLGCIVWLLVLVLVGMVLWKVIPVKIHNAELYDYMVELTKFAGNSHVEDIKKKILLKARELELPVTDKQVVIEKTREKIRIRCFYTVPVELPGYTWEMEVDHDIDRPIFYL